MKYDICGIEISKEHALILAEICRNITMNCFVANGKMQDYKDYVKLCKLANRIKHELEAEECCRNNEDENA